LEKLFKVKPLVPKGMQNIMICSDAEILLSKLSYDQMVVPLQCINLVSLAIFYFFIYMFGIFNAAIKNSLKSYSIFFC